MQKFSCFLLPAVSLFLIQRFFAFSHLISTVDVKGLFLSFQSLVSSSYLRVGDGKPQLETLSVPVGQRQQTSVQGSGHTTSSSQGSACYSCVGLGRFPREDSSFLQKGESLGGNHRCTVESSLFFLLSLTYANIDCTYLVLHQWNSGNNFWESK